MVSEVPKPLAPVEGRPFINYLINNWIKQGVTDFIFLLHFEAEKIIQELDDFSLRVSNSQLRFRILVEKTPLGTGGAILNAIKHFDLKQGFLVANADTWLGSGIRQLASSNSAEVASVFVTDTGRYGSLNISGNQIVGFNEKVNSGGPGHVNSGLYHLLPEVFDDHKGEESFSIENKIFPLLAKKGELKAQKLETEFIDIGIPEDYLKFCKWVSKGGLDGF